jgi:hypothetical protein
MVSTTFVNSPTENHTAYLITYSDSSAAVPSIMAQALRAPAFYARLSNAVRPAHNAEKTSTHAQKMVEDKLATTAVRKCIVAEKGGADEEAGGSAKGDGGGSKKRKKGKDSREKDEVLGFSTGGGSSTSAASRAATKSRSGRQTQAESPRKPTARHHSQKSRETPAPQQDIQKEGLQTGGNLISDTESDAPANTRNRGKRVRMLDDSYDDHTPRGAEEGSGRTVKMPKISQPGDSKQWRSDEVIVISDNES